MWKICCWINILVWNYGTCIVILKGLVLDGSLQYVQCVPYSEILQIFLLICMIDTVDFIHLPCPNDNRYDDAVFVDRFPYQLTMFENRLLIGLSLLHHAHNAHETDTSKIKAQFCRMSYCFAWFDTVEFSCLPYPNDKMYDNVVSLIYSDIN